MSLHGLHAEGNAAQAENPASQDEDYQANKPLQTARFFLHCSLVGLATIVALDLEGFIVSGGDTVGGNQRRGSRSQDVLH